MGKAKVKVRFYASLRDGIGVRRITVELNSPDFSSLVDELKKVLGNRISYILASNGRIRKELMISVNNKLIHHSDIESLRLKNDDVVDVMPPPSGG